MLYARMFIVLVITLFTTRELLSIVGIDDYGIINLIGGVVILFSFLNNALSSTTQRFLNYHIGINDNDKLSSVFKASLICHLLICLLVLLLGETIGLWFINAKLNIPPDKIEAVNILYQFTIFSTLLSIIRVPYFSTIIAYERMGLFAVISVIEAVLKLGVVYLLIFTQQKIVVYSMLLFISTAVVTFIYYFVCFKTFEITRIEHLFSTDKKQIKEQLSFSGWYLLGGSANVGAAQGTSFIFNIFFGVALNAAIGVANQVKSGVHNFVGSFQTAFNPQLVKLYASNCSKELNELIIFSSKVSFCLLCIVCFPIIFYCDEILIWWLKDIPPYSVPFTRLTLIMAVIDALSSPLWIVIGATGRVKYYQIIVSLIIISSIPIMIVMAHITDNPIVIFSSSLICFIFAYIYRIFCMINRTTLSLRIYSISVLGSAIIISALSFVTCYYINAFFLNNLHWFILTILDCIIIGVISFGIVTNKSQRAHIYSTIKSKIHIYIK